MIEPTVQQTAPANPAGHSPLRRAASIRRTSSIDAQWPQGLGQPVEFTGRARDLFTPPDNSPSVVLGYDWVHITASPGREIMSITGSRETEAAQALIGMRAGSHLRAKIAENLPGEYSNRSLLHLLLDDFSGASLVAHWAWSRGDARWTETIARSGVPMTAGKAGKMDGICAGFRPGSTALRSDGMPNPDIQSSAAAPLLPHPDDPAGWHELPIQSGAGYRRARRLDVWVDGPVHIDAGFQDSAATPVATTRQVVHEYRVFATAAPADFSLLSIDAIVHVLPYRECPAAAPNAKMLVGKSLSKFRLDVLDTLRGTLGCTHLNDVLRSLADVPALAARLLSAEDILPRL